MKRYSVKTVDKNPVEFQYDSYEEACEMVGYLLATYHKQAIITENIEEMVEVAPGYGFLENRCEVCGEHNAEDGLFTCRYCTER